MVRLGKKQEVIEAFRFTGAGYADYEDLPWAVQAFETGHLRLREDAEGRELQVMGYGVKTAEPGAWVTRDAEGCLGVCTDEVLTRDYDFLDPKPGTGYRDD